MKWWEWPIQIFAVGLAVVGLAVYFLVEIGLEAFKWIIA